MNYRRSKKTIDPTCLQTINLNSKTMKNLLFCLTLLLSGIAAVAQDSLQRVVLPREMTIHFISPQPIQYVDISNKAIIGDLALPNVLRIRLKDSSASFTDALLTITGETFMAQYHLIPGLSASAPTIAITPSHTRPLDVSGIGLSTDQLRRLALSVISYKPGKKVEKVSAFGITGQLNHVYTIDDYIFLDVSYRNRSRLQYDIEAFRFKLDDRKVTKASNVQSLEVKPLFILDGRPGFYKGYRNVFVFKKMSFPGNKVLRIELSEKQISGRVLTLQVAYKDILSADNLPN